MEKLTGFEAEKLVSGLWAGSCSVFFECPGLGPRARRLEAARRVPVEAVALAPPQLTDLAQ